MALYNFLKQYRNLPGIQYGLRIFIGTGILWFCLRNLIGLDPLWAIISLIIVTDQDVENTLHNFKSRIVNTTIGCLTGLAFLSFIHNNSLIMLPVALMTAICVSTALIRTPYGWRITAITTAIIIIPSFMESSRMVGMSVAFQRTMEVFLGSAAAVLVAWLLARMKNLAYA